MDEADGESGSVEQRGRHTGEAVDLLERFKAILEIMRFEAGNQVALVAR
jgi:hypothetical protein